VSKGDVGDLSYDKKGFLSGKKNGKRVGWEGLRKRERDSKKEKKIYGKKGHCRRVLCGGKTVNASQGEREGRKRGERGKGNNQG